MALAVELEQVGFSLVWRIRRSGETAAGNLDVESNVLDQRLLADIIVFRAYESEDEEIHAGAIKVVGESVKNVDLLEKDSAGGGTHFCAGMPRCIRFLVFCFLERQKKDLRVHG